MTPPFHPPTKLYTYPWVGKSSQISNLQTELKYLDSFKLYYVLTDLGVPPWGNDVCGCMWGVPCMHMHMHDIIGFPKGFPHEAAICMKLSCLTNMHVCACMCLHVHACMGVWGCPTHPHPFHLPPRGNS